MKARPVVWLTWGALAFFMVNLVGIVGAVVTNSFAESWFGTWLPDGYTGKWYGEACSIL